MCAYNLVHEPWIPCLREDGSAVELGLCDTLVSAHTLREIYDHSPLVTVALHRLLLAILHRVFGPPTFDGWVDLWNRASWEAAPLKRYFAQWEDRFDLFDSVHPFYQVAAMEDAQDHPSAALALELASGNNATLFDHSVDHSPIAMPPSLLNWIREEQALLLQRFSTGKGHLRDGHWRQSLPDTRIEPAPV